MKSCIVKGKKWIEMQDEEHEISYNRFSELWYVEKVPTLFVSKQTE